MGFLAAHVCHAAGESSPGNLSPGTNAVILAARSEAELAALEYKLAQAGIPHVSIREPDSPWDGALTAIGLVPTTDRRKLKPFLSSLPLLGFRSTVASDRQGASVDQSTEDVNSRRCPDCEAAGGLCYTHNGGLRRATP